MIYSIIIMGFSFFPFERVINFAQRRPSFVFAILLIPRVFVTLLQCLLTFAIYYRTVDVLVYNIICHIIPTTTGIPSSDIITCVRTCPSPTQYNMQFTTVSARVGRSPRRENVCIYDLTGDHDTASSADSQRNNRNKQ